MKFLNQKRGFTLIELMVAVAIIGVLAAISMYSFRDAKMRGRDARRQKDIHELRTALNIYATSNNKYPTNGNGATVTVDGNDYMSQALLNAGYIPKKIVDPAQTGNYVYGYETNAAGSTYTIHYCLEKRSQCLVERP